VSSFLTANHVSREWLSYHLKVWSYLGRTFDWSGHRTGDNEVTQESWRSDPWQRYDGDCATAVGSFHAQVHWCLRCCCDTDRTG